VKEIPLRNSRTSNHGGMKITTVAEKTPLPNSRKRIIALYTGWRNKIIFLNGKMNG
jgi:hypothetical protein